MDFSPGQHGNAMGLPAVLSAVAAGAGSFVIASLDAGPLLALAWVAVSVAAALLARRALSPEAATPGLARWLQRLRSGENVPPLEAGSLGPLASCAEDLNALAVGQRLRDVSLARLQVPLQRIPEGIRLARKGIDRSRESIEEAVEETASRMANVCLRAGSWYRPDAIQARAEISQQNATTAEEFSRRLVTKLLKDNSPPIIRVGKQSLFLPALKKWVPTRRLDLFLIRKFNVNSVQNDG